MHTVQFAQEQGLIHTASPAMLLVGGVALLVIGAIMVALTKVAGKNYGALMETGGYLLGILGAVAIYGGAFGWVWPPWS